ncbi:MAG: hypothetical protein ABIO80_05625 [Sphingomicrobium sp.]
MPEPMESDDRSAQAPLRKLARSGEILPMAAAALARRAGAAGLSAAQLMATHLVPAAAAFMLFWTAHYWLGLIAAAAAILVCAAAGVMHGPQSRRPMWSETAALAVALGWWWSWAHGLTAYGQPLAPVYGIMVLWAAIGGTIADRAIALLFARRFKGVVLDQWRPFDRRFSAVAASTTVNLGLLAAGLLVERPAAGLVLVGWWAMATALVHAVRLAQAGDQAARGAPVRPWSGQ